MIMFGIFIIKNENKNENKLSQQQEQQGITIIIQRLNRIYAKAKATIHLCFNIIIKVENKTTNYSCWKLKIQVIDGILSGCICIAGDFGNCCTK